jgi:integrase
MLLINRQKTNTAATIPLLRPAAEVLAKYGGERLPVPSNQYYNRMLKQVAYMIGLQKHITTHVGRKTAGMILLQDGVSMTIVSRVLGHKSVSITEKHYAHVLADTVTNEMSKVLGHQTVGVTRTVQPFLTEFAGYLASGADSSEGWNALRA